jgi:hypothetical protein
LHQVSLSERKMAPNLILPGPAAPRLRGLRLD